MCKLFPGILFTVCPIYMIFQLKPSAWKYLVMLQKNPDHVVNGSQNVNMLVKPIDWIVLPFNKNGSSMKFCCAKIKFAVSDLLMFFESHHARNSQWGKISICNIVYKFVIWFHVQNKNIDCKSYSLLCTEWQFSFQTTI